MSYAPRRQPEHETLAVRGLEQHVIRWRGVEPRPIVLLHGFLDAGATFQFLVDCLAEEHTLLAPDWRGFGRSGRPSGGYWFPDYFADLEAVLDRESPDQPVVLVGHSMGGNIANIYAGIRPERVSAVVSLEGFGLPDTTPDMAPGRYRQWLDQLRAPSRFLHYPSYEALAEILAKRNPRLSRERAEFIARAWGREDDRGRVVLLADPAHRWVNPVLYRHAEVEACWAQIQAPVLMVLGGQSEYRERFARRLEERNLRRLFRRLSLVWLEDAGHMLHHEQPERVAELIEAFLQGLRPVTDVSSEH